MLFFPIVVSLIIIYLSYLSYLLCKFDEIYIGNLDLFSFIIANFPASDAYPPNPFESIKSARVARGAQLLYIIEPLIYFKDPDLKKVKFEDILIPGGDEQTTMNVRLYNHDKSSIGIQSKKKVLVFYHGGGWVIGSAKENHILTAQLAKEYEFLVISVDYRLAPEHVFPAAVNDSYAALVWVIENIAHYGGDPSSIILSGESAGGNLAAAVASRHLINHVREYCQIKDEKELVKIDMDSRECLERSFFERFHGIRGLWLMYPPLAETSFSQEALQFNKVNKMLNLDKIEFLRRVYQGGANITDLELRQHYSFSPIRTPDLILSHYPPTLFTLAKYDVLTPESNEFAAKLRSFGRSVTVSIYNSTVHGFVTSHISLGGKAIKEFIEYSNKNF